MAMAPPALAERGPEAAVGDWVLRIAVAGFFFLVGFEKFSGNPQSEWVGIFQRIGLGVWFRYFTGSVEVLGGLLFLIPWATLAGAGLLIAAMCGAAAAHWFRLGDPGASVIPLALGAGVAAVAYRVHRAPARAA